ncbi:MAG TPA: SLC13/DASS family transporter [candidate division Zixibacteria bacterium]|nr:SLC13/DASS family transporter [candidate division Zixibacteria bacterium]HEQ99697.1 SLC13/DASS family transporter [candidate division Zixibacteria bacterium]
MAKKIAIIAGPLLALVIILFFDLDPDNRNVTLTAAVAVWMAVWWITEAIPIAATALLPVALFPLLGVAEGREIAGKYFNHIIFLFMGGFMIALALQRWNLHKRIALKIMLLIGTSPSRIILGFMAASFFLSMWISNTATVMMMLPIAMAVIARLKDSFEKQGVDKVATSLLLGTAYASSVGGMATLIGTPPNLAFAKIFEETFPMAPEISFAGWIIFSLPISLVFLLFIWAFMSFKARMGKGRKAANRSIFIEEYKKLGPFSYEEKVVMIDFMILAFLWLFRNPIPVGDFVIPGWSTLLPVPEFIDDGTVSISMALILFLIPSRTRPGRMIMDWKTAVSLPWGIVILFGGGFALAYAFKASGLSVWIGSQLGGLAAFHPLLIIAVICLTMTFLTELTSNTATTQTILPIIAGVAIGIGVNPLLLMVPATLSASCAFMLPVATPPNAIVYGGGDFRIATMAKAGIVLNLFGVFLISLAFYFMGRIILGVELGAFPDWAVAP